jgi:ribosomal protein S18 acetylase RimI-like enzyme
MIYRLATLEDVAAIVALVESAYRGTASQSGWTSEAHLLHGQRTDAAMITDMLHDPQQVILLFENPDLIGCLNAQRHPSQVYFGMISVSPTVQAQGCGRQMLEAAELWAQENWQAAKAHMSVIRQRSELIAWYQRRGYSLTGETVAFPYGDPRFGIPQRDDLEMLVLAKTIKK